VARGRRRRRKKKKTRRKKGMGKRTGPGCGGRR
jgi:hypothetical protein